MLNSIDRITWRNGFRLNGAPAVMEDIEDIFEGRRAAALSIWAQYEKLKEELREMNLSPEEYQAACRQIAEMLGI
ncbi:MULTISPECIES: hypothetical protein [Enterobacteriaceae]|uniref:hypothetical protein n=1 Tax=Enterobacteriaceae TaxID=543 RepID=UPI0002D311EB|nr:MULTISPECIES: hypothetical protein [Enterobacteriaceae]MBA7876751.1 hypothetical protein [Citrobacter sp. RHBSTW-00827]MBA7938206.1 hypothetical protein [Citrobacter sp. RHBSTW-00509]MCU3443784.1 hypothetical protein [Enterobacter asburiae]QLS94288.1 hypothetical protein HV302_10000 [Citrobacter sp. RHBSTW-00859]QLT53675.1 hypothetical protein HV285_10050 [Citrobacter sp. RHBSTW-00821]